jgi:hypothetical protein
MDFTKLLSLLENRQLFFTRADQFEDPYEGTWSKASVTLLRNPKLNGGLPINAADQIIACMDKMRKKIFISCWYTSEHESAAMWKLYLQSCEGVAIRTDHTTLFETLNKTSIMTRTTLVKYIDYESTLIPFGNLFFPFIYKRMSFSHEKELRVIIWSEEDVNLSQIDSNATYFNINVIPEELIKAVHVSPMAPKWFGKLVEQILQRYGITCPIERSSLYDRPSY